MRKISTYIPHDWEQPTVPLTLGSFAGRYQSTRVGVAQGHAMAEGRRVRPTYSSW